MTPHPHPHPGLTSADESLLVECLLAYTTVLALLKRLHPERVRVNGLKILRLQKKKEDLKQLMRYKYNT